MREYLKELVLPLKNLLMGLSSLISQPSIQTVLQTQVISSRVFDPLTVSSTVRLSLPLRRSVVRCLPGGSLADKGKLSMSAGYGVDQRRFARQERTELH